MTTFFFNHLQEVKFHFHLLFFLTLTFFSISFYYSDQWLYVLMNPLIQIKQSNYFIATDLIEIFYLKLTVSFLFSGVGGTLLGIFQGWIFLAPGLYKHENKLIGQILILFLGGFSLAIPVGFFYLIPHMWDFFHGYEKTEHPFLFNLYFEPKLSTYIFFLLQTLGCITFFLQYPIFLFLLLKTRILTIHQFTKFRKLWYLKILILSSFLAPPDWTSQWILFILFIFWIEWMILVFFIWNQR